MDTFTWLKVHSDPELERQTEEKINTIRIFEKDVPAVVIVHDLADFSVVYMSQRGLDYLQTDLQSIRVSSAEYHARYFNMEDAKVYAPKILDLVARNNTEDLVTYFQQVRSSPDLPWTWHMSSTKILLRDKNGAPRLVITLAMPVETEHPMATKIERLLEEHAFLQRNQKIFASLTKRETEILKLMALGYSSQELAEKLHITESTANTHRRNIRSKLNAETPYDITRFAQAFDLI